MEPGTSTIERMIGGEFTSDPRNSRFPLPEIPEGTPDGIPYVHSGFVVTPEMAKDWILNRSIRREITPSEMAHDEMCPNRKYLISYATSGAKKLKDNPNWWNKGIPQGGAFTKDGYLLDSQHRFSWCALSGVPITLPIAVNTPWSAWKDIDQNRRRSAAQMVDIPYAVSAVSVARYLIPVLEGNSATVYTRNGRDYEEQAVEICLGWPYFQDGQSWMKEIYEAAQEAGIPTGALGSLCIGSLAGGIPADEVQQFLNGLRRISRDVESITIGTDGHDPRKLAFQHFDRLRRARDKKGRLTGPEERAAVGTIRYCFDVWMRRVSDNPKKIKIVQRWAETSDLPSIFNEREIRAFHAKYVN